MPSNAALRSVSFACCNAASSGLKRQQKYSAAVESRAISWYICPDTGYYPARDPAAFQDICLDGQSYVQFPAQVRLVKVTQERASRFILCKLELYIVTS